MTSGNDLRRLAAIAALVAMAMIPTQSPADTADQTPSVWTVESLMAGLHQVKSASAHFVERKEIAMLTRVLESTGTLSYVAPDHLQKITLTPAPETFTLDGEMLSGVQANGDHYTVSLSDRPEVASLVEAVRSTLAGDLATLRRYYWIDCKGNRDDWELDLTPKNSRVRDKLDGIRIKGAELALKTIDIDERDGDHSRMTIIADRP